MRKFKLAVLLWVFFLALTCMIVYARSIAESPAPEPTEAAQLVLCDLPLLEPTPTLEPAPEPVPEPVKEPEVVPADPLWTDEEVTVLAKMVWGEARGVKSVTEQAACVWCALNRCDASGDSIVKVVTAPYQFQGYDKDNPIDDEIKALCEDVLTRWYAEKDGATSVGRVLPPDYQFFHGDGVRNWFRNAYKGGQIWDWSMVSPYES